jgi:hypothetical protein
MRPITRAALLSLAGFALLCLVLAYRAGHFTPPRPLPIERGAFEAPAPLPRAPEGPG